MATPEHKLDKINSIEEAMKEETSRLMNSYISTAIMFADLHDTSNRLVEKGCISEIVPWRTSRPFFYWRLKRLVLTQFFIKKISECDSKITHAKAIGRDCVGIIGSQCNIFSSFQ
jgi:acetyl-CoA carboxylase/biotin carboxylase 1